MNARYGLVTIAGLMLTACGDTGPKPLPEGSLDVRVKALCSDLTEVVEVSKGETLMITYFKPSIADGRHWASSLFQCEFETISRLREAARGVDYKSVTFMAKIPTRDNLGNEGSQLGMKLTYQLEKFAGAKWDSMTMFDMAELADDIQFKRLGKEAALEYCKENAEYTRKFCARLVASYMR